MNYDSAVLLQFENDISDKLSLLSVFLEKSLLP